jgi:hypothetical protein
MKTSDFRDRLLFFLSTSEREIVEGYVFNYVTLDELEDEIDRVYLIHLAKTK